MNVFDTSLSASSDSRGDIPCVHCGEPVPAALASSDELPFCCDGCRAVYTILQQNGLCTYYDVSSERPNTAASVGAFDGQAFDSPTVRRYIVEHERDNVVQLMFTVPSIHCASCVWLLERLERLNSGVLRSRVDVMRKIVRVEADLSITSISAIANLMASLGYPPVVTAEGGFPQASSERRSIYLRLGVAGFAMANVMIFSIAQYLAGDTILPAGLEFVFAVASVILSVPVLVYSASPWFTASWAAIRHKTLTLDVPVAVGIAILFARSIADVVLGVSEGYLDSFNGLVFFLLIGRLFQQKAFDAVAFDRTWRSFFPLTVRRLEQGATVNVPIDDVRIGDVVALRPGEVLPCDATLNSPVAYVDYAFVTGESTPVECVEGDSLHAGGRVIGRAITCTVTREAHRGYLASLWERQHNRKKRSTLLDVSSSFGKAFVLSAFAIAVGGALWWLPDVSMSLQVLTAVLIIACPCALTLAAPVALGTAMGRLARKGIFVKNVAALLELAYVRTVVFDKTGTLTHATVTADGLEVLTDHEIALVASVAAQSTHPVSRALCQALPQSGLRLPASFRELPGCGITATIDGHEVVIGSGPWVCQVTDVDTSVLPEDTMNTTMIAIDGGLRATIRIRSIMRKGVPQLVQSLRSRHAVRLVSGDSHRDRTLFESVFRDDEMTFNAMPEDKLQAITEHRHSNGGTLMVGDGLNDGPALSAADVAIAVTDDTATIVPACDVIMRADAVSAIPSLLAVARDTHKIVWVNFLVSMVYNAVGISMAVMGVLSPLAVAILMPVSSLTVIAISVVGARRSVGRHVWA